MAGGISPYINPEKESMNFGQAISSCLSKYATFSGRASRSEYWWFVLFQFLALFIAIMVSEVLYGLVALGLLLPALAVGARRLHDIGKSGWWQLLALTGIGSFVLLYWYVQPSDHSATTYNAVST